MFSIINLLPAILFFCNALIAPEYVNPVDKSIQHKSSPLELNIYKDKNALALEKLVKPWLLFYTNKYRREHRVDTLEYDDCLLQAAGFHADYLFNESKDKRQYTLEHIQSNSSKWYKGKTPTDRASSAGCDKTCGENILFYTRNALPLTDFANNAKLNLEAKEIARNMVYDQWDKSPTHKENMLNKDYGVFGGAVSIGWKKSNLNYTDNVPAKLIIFGTQVFAF